MVRSAMKKKEDTVINDNVTEESEKLRGKYLRALADYQNLEKRVITQRQQLFKYASERVIIKLLPVLDIIEKTAEHLKDQGLTLVVKNFLEVLESEGVVKIDVVNKIFNPVEMECVEVVESDKDNFVIEELRSGYRLEDKVIRVAQVKVGKKKIDNRSEELVQRELQKGDYM